MRRLRDHGHLVLLRGASASDETNDRGPHALATGGAAAPSRASPARQFTEQIDGYDVTIEIQDDGSLRITEVIDYDFGVTEHHGIFRDVPTRLRYDDTYDRVYPLTVESVTAIGGASADYTVEDAGGVPDPDQDRRSRRDDLRRPSLHDRVPHRGRARTGSTTTTSCTGTRSATDVVGADRRRHGAGQGAGHDHRLRVLPGSRADRACRATGKIGRGDHRDVPPAAISVRTRVSRSCWRSRRGACDQPAPHPEGTLVASSARSAVTPVTGGVSRCAVLLLVGGADR